VNITARLRARRTQNRNRRYNDRLMSSADRAQMRNELLAIAHAQGTRMR
jgi:hypothetical protein